MRQLQSARRPVPAPPAFLTDGEFILETAANDGQKASAGRAINGAAPVLSLARWAAASGRIRSRK